MNTKETTDFVQQVAIAFPGVVELLEKSPATLGVWAKTLEQVSSREASTVLSRWVNGSLPDPPVGFRRELFALDVRAVVMKDRADAMRFKAIENASRSRIAYPSAAFRSIAKPYSEILGLRSRVMAGDLSAEECDRQIEAIIEGAFAT